MLTTLFALCIIIALVVWAVPQIGAALKIPANVITIIYVFLVVAVVLYLMRLFGLPTFGL